MRPSLLVQLALALFAQMEAPRPDGPPAPREEYFVLELPTPSEGRFNHPPVPVAVGVGALRVALDGDFERAEWHLQFFDDATHVQHVERWLGTTERLIWREWRPGGGRTLSVETNTATGRAVLVEWGREESLRTSFETQPTGGPMLPLHLLELARRGELGRGRLTCFEPLSRCMETTSVELAADEPPDECAASDAAVRTFTLRDADGVQTCAYSFRGDDLVEVQWQPGGLMARRIERLDYERRRAEAQPAEAGALSSR